MLQMVTGRFPEAFCWLKLESRSALFLCPGATHRILGGSAGEEALDLYSQARPTIIARGLSEMGCLKRTHQIEVNTSLLADRMQLV